MNFTPNDNLSCCAGYHTFFAASSVKPEDIGKGVTQCANSMITVHTSDLAKPLLGRLAALTDRLATVQIMGSMLLPCDTPLELGQAVCVCDGVVMNHSYHASIQRGIVTHIYHERSECIVLL